MFNVLKKGFPALNSNYSWVIIHILIIRRPSLGSLFFSKRPIPFATHTPGFWWFDSLDIHGWWWMVNNHSTVDPGQDSQHHIITGY